MSAMRLSGACPKCRSPLVRRTRRSDGNPFLSCSGYPDCKFAEDYDPHLNELADQVRVLTARVDSLQAQLRSQGTARSSPDLSRELRAVIAAAHPDRWPTAPDLAHLVVAKLNALRAKLA
jgi:ssDNA-binding Zn-finger/Zn-ribbon topoisomerase 1